MEALKELNLTDLGAAKLEPAEFYTDEIIGWVEGLNPDLGTAKDPYYNEYNAFYNEIKNNKIITLDVSAYQKGNKYDELDLSGENEPTKDITDQFMMFMGMLIFGKSVGATPYDIVKGDTYAPFMDIGLTPWDRDSIAVGE